MGGGSPSIAEGQRVLTHTFPYRTITGVAHLRVGTSAVGDITGIGDG